MSHKFCASFACLLLLFTVNLTAQTRRRLSEAEVIKKAEAFIIEQGYTDLPPTQDKSKLKAAFDEGTDEFSLGQRRNTLLKEAHGIAKGTSRNLLWLVVFRFNPDNEGYRRHVPDFESKTRKVGRAVTMDVYGKDIRIQHQDVFLKFEGLKKIAR